MSGLESEFANPKMKMIMQKRKKTIECYRGKKLMNE